MWYHLCNILNNWELVLVQFIITFIFIGYIYSRGVYRNGWWKYFYIKCISFFELLKTFMIYRTCYSGKISNLLFPNDERSISLEKLPRTYIYKYIRGPILSLACEGTRYFFSQRKFEVEKVKWPTFRYPRGKGVAVLLGLRTKREIDAWDKGFDKAEWIWILWKQ